MPSEQYAVTDPSTGEVVHTVETDTDSRVDEAVGIAHAAYQAWGRISTTIDRSTALRRVAALHLERGKELAQTMTREMGKPHDDAIGEIEFSAAIYEYYADHAAEFLADEPITLREGTGSAVVRRRPIGVLLGIMPWNFPAYQVARFAAPNLAAGNTVLLKHAPQCPDSARALEQIFLDAGFPTGAYVNLYATNEQVEQVISDPRVQGVSLTGSERAGAAVAEIAGRYLKKVVLELGGSDPFIVLSTGDLDATVDAAVAARMDNAGQACNAAKRIIVIDDLYDDFVVRFTQKMLATGAQCLSSRSAAERLHQQVQAVVADGAALSTAGVQDGAFYPAAVLTEIDRSRPSYREELFGPVAAVFRVRDEDEAVEVANDTPYGLGSYVFTTDKHQAARLADRLDVGMVFINGVGAEGAELPFGGVKRSGFGRELGRFGVEEFVNKKLIRTVE